MSKARIPQILWAAALSITSAAMLAPAALGGETARTASAASEPAGTLDLSYEMRFWFVPFGHTTYRGVFADNTYQASSYFKTSGLVSVFWQAEIDAGASGNVETRSVAPYVYDSFATRSSEKKQRVKLTYDGKGPPKLFANPAYNTKQFPVSVEEQEKGVDPMSAVTLIVSGLSADAKNPCGTVAPVFDGRRRYNVEFTYLKDQPLKLENGLYSGPAHLCRIRYHQIAGYKQEILSGDKSKWPPIFALVADIPDASAPLGHYVVPLKMWAKTEWGTVTVELSALNASGGTTKG